jgi:Glycosyl hydrolases family 38 C-terminal beta sandwich domain
MPPACLPLNPAVSSEAAAPPGLLAQPVAGLETVTLKTSESGDGLILPLRDPSGRAGKRTLRFRLPSSSPAPQLVLCTLLEDEQERLRLGRSAHTASVTLTLPPFEVIRLNVMP